jgi:hypothetical protein
LYERLYRLPEPATAQSELYGRVPRAKTNAQMLTELDRCFDRGRVGW